MKRTITPYEQERPNLQTGDEIICGGKSWVSLLIKIITMSWASHVGKVYKDGNCLWIWHSTSLGKGKSGPQREQLRTWLKRYDGKVAIRHLSYVDRPLGWRPEGFQSEYIATIKEFKDKEYETNYLELAGSALPWRNKPNLATIFCSEQNAEIDMRTGVLLRRIPANEYTPKDSLLGGEKSHWMFKKVNYGKLIWLK